MVHWFLEQITDRSALSPMFDTEIGLCGSHGTEKKPVDREVGNLVGGLWLAGLQPCHSGWGFREATKGDAEECCRQVYGEGLDGKDLGSKPKLCVLNVKYM